MFRLARHRSVEVSGRETYEISGASEWLNLTGGMATDRKISANNDVTENFFLSTRLTSSRLRKSPARAPECNSWTTAMS